MNLTTLGLAQSIRQNWPIALLAHIDHPDGAVRAWTGTGDLPYAGERWEGVGQLAGLQGVGGGRRLTVRQVSFRLSGVPPKATESLNARVRGRTAQAWIAGLDAGGGNVNGTAWQIADGVCDVQELSVDDDGTATITIIVSEPVFSIERAQNLSFTPEWINARFPSSPDRITGLDLISGLASKTVNWTRT